MSHSELKDKNVAVHLTEKDIKGLEDSGNFSSAEISDIKQARKDGYNSIASHGNTLTTMSNGAITGYSHTNAVASGPNGVSMPTAPINQRATIIAGKSVTEVGNLPVDVFKNPSMYASLNPAIVEERLKAGVSQADKASIKAALMSHLGVSGLPSSWGLAGTPNSKWQQWATGNSFHAADLLS